MTLDDFLLLFSGNSLPVADGDGWLCFCPLHASPKPELRLVQRGKKIHIACLAQDPCRVIDILATQKLKLADLNGKGSVNGHRPQSPPSNPPNSQTAAQPQSGKIYNTTDMGNAERFFDLHSHKVRYCSQLGKDGHWLVWDNRRWKVDHTLRIHTLAKQVVPTIYADIPNAPTQKEKKRLFSWAIHTEGLSARNNMIKDARPLVAIEVSDLDQHLWLLNVKNGTLDLRTGQIRPHSQDDKLTKLINVEYDIHDQCPVWEEFLDACMNGNRSLIEYLQRAVGYTLTGDVSEKAMFVMHGPPDTGKTTFIETLQLLLDEYSAKIQMQTLMWRRDRNNTNDIARLKGARLVHASEAEENERLAEAQVKELTGGDTIIARFLHAEFFQFMPEFKLWLATNHKPRVSNDDAVWNRLKLIPFVIRVPKDRQDKQLKGKHGKLAAELPGILRWAVDGCLAWQREGLMHPDDVIAATKDYRSQMDVIGQFIEECCELGDSFSEMSRVLYEEYKQWSTDMGEKIESQRALGLKLTDRGLTNSRTTGGKTRWHGIRLQPKP